VEGRPTVTAVAPGVEDVRPGDVVLRVDGLSADSLLRARGELVSSATPQWRRFVTNVSLLMGRDSLVRVTVQHPASDTATVRLRRAPGPGVREPKPDPVAQLRPGIWYVDLDRVTTAQLQAALPELERAAGIVFDLRGYPDGLNPFILFSHLIREPATSARWIVPLVTHPDRVGLRWHARERWQLRPMAPYLVAPRVFITDGRAISYAESVMGIVEAYRLGEIVGEPTAGTNGNVNPFVLPGGYSVSWTGDAGAQARRLAAPRPGHPPHHPGAAHARRRGGRPRRAAGARRRGGHPGRRPVSEPGYPGRMQLRSIRRPPAVRTAGGLAHPAFGRRGISARRQGAKATGTAC
jgi:hypothetical protein